MKKDWEKSRGDRAMLLNAKMVNLSRKQDVVHQGETESEWRARTGKVPTTCPPAIVDGYVNIYAHLRAAAPHIKGPGRPAKGSKKPLIY